MASRILIVKLSSLGDVLHTLPAAQALRRQFPTAHIAWAIEQLHAPLIADQPWLDEQIVWQRTKRGGFRKFIAQLRAQSWDIAIDFQGLFRSGLVTRLSGARRRIGAAQARELAPWFYTERVQLPSLDVHAVEKSFELVKPLGAVDPRLPLARPYLDSQSPRPTQLGRELFPLFPSTNDRAAVDRWCEEHRYDPARERLVILNPDCRREANRWPVARFADVARRLLDQPGVRVALTGGPGARAMGDEIAAAVGKNLWRADGRFSLLGSVELFSRAHLLLTGDTGPMHLAAAVDLPVVALIGATAPSRTGPYTSDAVVVRQSLDCMPCLAKKCRLGHAVPPCMEQIDVERVVNVIRARLDDSAANLTLRRSA
jgi:ADP-heptose:LPS heptosyltransferase